MTPKEFAEKYYENAVYLHLSVDIEDSIIEDAYDVQGEFAVWGSLWNTGVPEDYNSDVAELAKDNECKLYILWG